ncbi:MAG: SpoIVB peptidase [Oscillospiraceae bacterium]|nr:SpoIVB peptidase [Oscillospiraceae bacterium]
MKKAVRQITVFLSLCCCMIFAFLGYGMASLPEELSVTERALPVLSAPYSAQNTEITNTGAKVSQTTALQEGTVREAAIRLFGIIPVKSAKITTTKRSYVTVGGDVFGIKLYTRGVLVAKTDLVSTENGNENPAQKAGLRSGDLITEINGAAVNRKSEVAAAIESSEGAPLRLTVEREGKPLRLQLRPLRGADGGKYLAGLWIRDSSAGIGTVTFYDPQSRVMAGLGHAICDVDTGEIIPISGGELVAAKVMGCYKGASGKPGELCGVFEPQKLADLLRNGENGIYGRLTEMPQGGEKLPVALKTEVRTGPAQLYVTVDGDGAKYYDVEITRVSLAGGQKNMTLRVKDPALLETTGGIVQGMSGSPLVQNGMLIGAVTHVFVSSPLEGYGIFAETMLETARQAADG